MGILELWVGPEHFKVFTAAGTQHSFSHFLPNFPFFMSFVALAPKDTFGLQNTRKCPPKCIGTFLSACHFQVILYALFSLFTRKLKHKRKSDGTKLGRQALPLFCSQH